MLATLCVQDGPPQRSVCVLVAYFDLVRTPRAEIVNAAVLVSCSGALSEALQYRWGHVLKLHQ